MATGPANVFADPMGDSDQSRLEAGGTKNKARAREGRVMGK